MLTSVDKLIEEKCKDSFWLNRSSVCRSFPSVTFHPPAHLSFPSFTLCRDQQQCLVLLRLTQSTHQCCLHEHTSTALPFIALAVWWRQSHILRFSPLLQDHPEMQHVGPYVPPQWWKPFSYHTLRSCLWIQAVRSVIFHRREQTKSHYNPVWGEKTMLCLAWIS